MKIFSDFSRSLLEKYHKAFLFIMMVYAFCCSPVNALAVEHDFLSKQGYIEVMYDSNSGLDSAAANDVAQTEDGFIWIGTYNGLIRYDGSEFYRYPVKCGITSVASLYVDSEDKLWIGTNDSGIACYRNGEFKFYKKEDGLGSNIVRAIAENDNGDIFVGTTRGLCYIKNGKVSPVEDDRLKQLYISKIKRALGNKIVGLTVKGDIFVYNGDKLETYISKTKMIIGQPESICPDKYEGDVYWVGTTGSTIMKMRLRGNDFTIEETMLTPGLVNINYICHHEGNLLIASDNGAAVFDENRQFHALNRLQTKHSIDKIMVDYENNIWFASSRQGVAKLTKTRFRNLFAEAGLKNTVVNAVTEYKDKLYIATDNGLLALSKGAVDSDKLTKFLRHSRTRHLMVDSKNNLWVATYSGSGLVKYSPDEQVTVFNERKGMSNSRVRCVLEASDGTIYAGTRYGLAIIRDDKVVKTLTTHDGLTNPQVLCLLEHEGKIYAGTDGGGICVIDKDKIAQVIGENDGLKNGVILRMTRDIDKKRVWISCGTAIAYLEQGKLHQIENFPSTNNFDFIFTPYGEMLINCNNGIYVTSSDKLRNTGSIIQLLSKRDGLSNSLTANSFNYIDKNDNLYLCLQDGVDVLNIRQLTETSNNLKLKVPSIFVDGKELFFDKSHELTIPSGTTRLTFKGYILSNSLNNATLYSILEGFDKEPEIYSRFNNKEKTYTNLPGGKYTLRVGIYDSKTDKIIKEQTYVIKKELKLSEHTGFFAAVFMAIVALGVVPYRLYMNKRLKAAKKKQKETEAILDQVINSFATVIDFKDSYTQGHSKRVAEYSRKLAKGMGWSDEAADNIHRIGMLHDVGKIIIPNEILNKRGPLTNEEYAKMKEHTDIGAKILSNITSFPSIAVGANTHHERYDGKGYGHHLAGKDIPIEGRIIAVADCFDAMNSNRIYRPGMTKEAILEQLEMARNTQLDAKIIDVLLKLIEKGEIKFQEDEVQNNN